MNRCIRLQKLKGRALALLILTANATGAATADAAASYLLPYPKTSYEISSSVYTLKVDNASVDVVKYYNRYSYAHLAYEGTATFTVSLKSGATITSFDISPHSYGLNATATKSGANLTFTVPQVNSRYLVVKISTSSGSLENLFVAADPQETGIPTIGGSVKDITAPPYNADNSGATLMTTTIQNAINDANTAGSGTVYFPAGVYQFSNISLKSGVTLYLAPGAVLRGSSNRTDYIWNATTGGAEPSQGQQNIVINGNISNVAIKGRGMIDANSTILVGGSMDGFGTYRKGIIHSGKSGSSRPNGIVLEGVTFKDATTWSFDIEDAKNVTIQNVKLLNDYEWIHSDGYDICSTDTALVDNCLSLTGDDALDAKGTSANPVTNVTYSNCVAFTHKGCGTKIGDQVTGIANNIRFVNIDAVECYRGMSISHDEGTAGYTNIYFTNVRTEKIVGTSTSGEFQVAPFVFWTLGGGAGPVTGVSVIGCYIENTAGFKGIIQGYNSSSVVANVAFQGLQMDGVAITSGNYTSKINAGPNISNITFATLSGPPQIAVGPAWVPSPLYAGQTASVTVTVSGAAPFTYNWKVGLNGNYTNLTDGGNISGSTNVTLTIASVQSTNALNYVVVVTNSYGSITSSVATLAVLPTSPATHFILNFGGTPIVEGVGSDWNNANVWNPGGLPASTSAYANPGSSYELVAGSRMRNPAATTYNFFPGATTSLIVDGDGIVENGTVNKVSEIRFKNSAAGSATTGGFYSTNYFPNLVLNGGELNIGDNTSIVIQGKVTAVTNSIFYTSGGGTNQSFQIDACLTGGGNIQFFDYNATNLDAVNSVLNITCPTNTFTGTWDIEMGPLVGNGTNSLGTNTITIGANGVLETSYPINNPNSTLFLNGRMFLTQTDTFNSVVINGTPLAPGTYSAATLCGLYTNFPATFVALYGTTATSASGAIKVGNVVVLPSSPHITSVQVSGSGGLTLSASNGTPSGPWTLLQSTNASLPLDQWQTNASGTFDGSGNLSTNILNTATNPQDFYILKVQ